MKPLTRLLDFLLPPACPLCQAPLAEIDQLCVACWQQVKFIQPPLCQITGRPMQTDLGEETISLEALANPPAYHKARSAFIYTGSGAALIRRMKFADHPEIAILLARMMMSAGAALLDETDYILPVPIHPRRLLHRRFNQSAEICRAMEKAGTKPILYDGLRRIRPTPQQIGLSRRQRQTNLRGAFSVQDETRSRLKGKHVLLIDDVITTGTTIEQCTKTLLKAGVARVNVLTAAQVVIGEK